MDKMTVTLKFPPGVKAWLAAEGDPLYRSATEQAAYLCAQTLIRAYRTATQKPKHGSRPDPTGDDRQGMQVPSEAPHASS